MAISLLIGYHNTRLEDRLVPVASDDTFLQHWLPLCFELKLRWVSRFGTGGWRLTRGDIPPILTELYQLRHHLTQAERPTEIHTHMLARLGVLAHEFSEIVNTPDAEAFVGSVWQSQHRPTPTFSPRIRYRSRPPRPMVHVGSDTSVQQNACVAITSLSASSDSSLPSDDANLSEPDLSESSDRKTDLGFDPCLLPLYKVFRSFFRSLILRPSLQESQ